MSTLLMQTDLHMALSKLLMCRHTKLIIFLQYTIYIKMIEDNEDYMIPYVLYKNKYLCMKKWISLSQNGGTDVNRSDVYAIFYNSVKHDVSYDVNQPFLSVKEIRTILPDAYVIKEHSTNARPVLDTQSVIKMTNFITGLTNDINGNNNNIVTVRFDNTNDVNMLKHIASSINNSISSNRNIDSVYIIELDRAGQNKLMAHHKLFGSTNYNVGGAGQFNNDNIYDYAVNNKTLKSAMEIFHSDLDMIASSSLDNGFVQFSINDGELSGGATSVTGAIGLLNQTLNSVKQLDPSGHIIGTLKQFDPSGNILTNGIKLVSSNVGTTSGQLNQLQSLQTLQTGLTMQNVTNVLQHSAPQYASTIDKTTSVLGLLSDHSGNVMDKMIGVAKITDPSGNMQRKVTNSALTVVGGVTGIPSPVPTSTIGLIANKVITNATKPP
jgi:hypothetical protein